ncbi:hypothetical protein [Pseudomonas putida]|uniref:hypothetical protein n=1 Tax=Pseudomonas putida TaxID=303 RepID=UPI003CC7EFC8
MSSRLGLFTIGRLSTSIGEFTIKDEHHLQQLEQTNPRQHRGPGVQQRGID